MKDSKIKWSCSLNNGHTYYEGKNDYIEIAGELSPYLRLLKYIKEKELKITSACLYSDDGRRWNLPAVGRNPKFRVFDTAEKPISYKFFRMLGMDMDLGGNKTKEEIYSVIEAEYSDGKKLQTWVAQNGGTSWSVIV